MSTLKSLRDRLRSIKNLLHITQAMEVVASVRFRKIISKMDHLRFYSIKFGEMIARLQHAVDADQHFLFKSRGSSAGKQRILVMVITSDKGLCGSYNNNVITKAEQLLNRLVVQADVELILIGQKAVDHFKGSQWPIRQQVRDIARKVDDQTIKKWCMEYLSLFERGEIDELWVVFTHYINILNRETRVERILPFFQEKMEATTTKINFLFEPTPQIIYDKMIPFYFCVKVQSILLESYASELSSRMVAMKAAAKNAEEMIDKLTLIKNKNRQLGITREILEITAGAEGLK